MHMTQYKKEAAGGRVPEDFHERVFRAARKIPRGKVATYKNIARVVGSPRAARAVGNALNKNRSASVPCHRVIRSDGRVGGYARGEARKISILKKEGISIIHGRVTDRRFFHFL